MSPLAFLALALGLSLVGSFFVFIWSRWPRRQEDGISTFSREMQALAPRQPIAPAAEQRPAPPGAAPSPSGNGGPARPHSQGEPQPPRPPDPGATVRITSRSEE